MDKDLKAVLSKLLSKRVEEEGGREAIVKKFLNDEEAEDLLHDYDTWGTDAFIGYTAYLLGQLKNAEKVILVISSALFHALDIDEDLFDGVAMDKDERVMFSLDTDMLEDMSEEEQKAVWKKMAKLGTVVKQEIYVDEED